MIKIHKMNNKKRFMPCMNKKGWIKIFEAAISIMLVLGFMILLYGQSIEKPRKAENLLRWEGQILDELKNIPELRQKIIEKNEFGFDDKGYCKSEGDIYGFISERLENSFPGFYFECRVCEVDEVCGMREYREEVFSEERIISSTLIQFSPKKIRIFVWTE